ncbi:Hsp70 family protein [Dactylosporangium sp. NPDC048998]|uniref:Hsp70 family protein n=1 Tax=Dactylosporangium sp. NPDC048998 TaxID=3363976 RepID=UPI00371BA567
MAAGPRLGIDFGTSHTVALLAWPDGRVRPLLFDGSPLLPSAVFAQTDGALLVGRDAVHAARVDPARFEGSPKRRIDDGTVLLGDREVTVPALIGAVLSHVAQEATRVAGGPVAELTLTHPAAWGVSRRLALIEGAKLAGLPQPALMPEPVAAAHYFAGVLQKPLTGDQGLLVYDFGGGTFDASLVSRSGDGFDVRAVDGIDDLGGLDLDELIVEHARGQITDPAVWARLDGPQSTEDRRHRRMLWDDARIAKEMLSRTPAAALHVPIAAADVSVTREQFEDKARPLLEQTVRTTSAVMRWAGVDKDRLAGLFLVGGSSRVPLVATLLQRELGLAPTIIEQPELVVAEGSLRAWVNVGQSAQMPQNSAIPAAAITPQTGQPPQNAQAAAAGAGLTPQAAQAAQAAQPMPGMQNPPNAFQQPPQNPGSPQNPQQGQPPRNPHAPVSGVPVSPAGFQQGAYPVSAPPVGQRPVSAAPVSPVAPGAFPVSGPPRVGDAEATQPLRPMVQPGPPPRAIPQPQAVPRVPQPQVFPQVPQPQAPPPQVFPQVPQPQMVPQAPPPQVYVSPAAQPAVYAPPPREEALPPARPRRNVAVPLLVGILVLALALAGYVVFQSRDRGQSNAGGGSSYSPGDAQSSDGPRTIPAYNREEEPGWVPNGWRDQDLGTVDQLWKSQPESEGGRCDATRDRLRVTTDAAPALTGCTLKSPLDVPMTDGSIEAKVHAATGCAGMWLRTGDKGYTLGYCSDGHLRLYRLGNKAPGPDSLLKDWAIQVSGDPYVAFKIEGDQLNAYVNGERFGPVSDGQIRSGKVDLGAFTLTDQTADASFSQVRVFMPGDWQPGPTATKRPPTPTSSSSDWWSGSPSAAPTSKKPTPQPTA